MEILSRQLRRDQKAIIFLKETPNLNSLSVKIPSSRLHTYFNGSFSGFLRILKNGLQKSNGVTNRSFFKETLGVWYSIPSELETEMILFYSDPNPNLDLDEIIMRIKKILGIDAKIEFQCKNRILPNLDEKTLGKNRLRFFGNPVSRSENIDILKATILFLSIWFSVYFG